MPQIFMKNSGKGLHPHGDIASSNVLEKKIISENKNYEKSLPQHDQLSVPASSSSSPLDAAKSSAIDMSSSSGGVCLSQIDVVNGKNETKFIKPHCLVLLKTKKKEFIPRDNRALDILKFKCQPRNKNTENSIAQNNPTQDQMKAARSIAGILSDSPPAICPISSEKEELSAPQIIYLPKLRTYGKNQYLQDNSASKSLSMSSDILKFKNKPENANELTVQINPSSEPVLSEAIATETYSGALPNESSASCLSDICHQTLAVGEKNGTKLTTSQNLVVKSLRTDRKDLNSQANISSSSTSLSSNTSENEYRYKGNFCSAVDCKNNKGRNPDLSFFAFPKEPSRFKEWATNCKRKDLLDINPMYIYRNIRLCSAHFDESQFIINRKRKRLVDDAIPTLFNISDLPQSTSDERKSPTVQEYCAKNQKTDNSVKEGYDSCGRPPNHKDNVKHANCEGTVIQSSEYHEENDNVLRTVSGSFFLRMVDHKLIDVNGGLTAESLCRICGKHDEEHLVSLFSDTSMRHHVPETINKYLPIKVTEDSSTLPNNICRSCLTFLIDWQCLIHKCQLTDKWLRKKFNVPCDKVEHENNLLCQSCCEVEQSHHHHNGEVKAGETVNFDHGYCKAESPTIICDDKMNNNIGDDNNASNNRTVGLITSSAMPTNTTASKKTAGCNNENNTSICGSNNSLSVNTILQHKRKLSYGEKDSIQSSKKLKSRKKMNYKIFSLSVCEKKYSTDNSRSSSKNGSLSEEINEEIKENTSKIISTKKTNMNCKQLSNVINGSDSSAKNILLSKNPSCLSAADESVTISNCKNSTEEKMTFHGENNNDSPKLLLSEKFILKQQYNVYITLVKYIKKGISTNSEGDQKQSTWCQTLEDLESVNVTISEVDKRDCNLAIHDCENLEVSHNGDTVDHSNFNNESSASRSDSLQSAEFSASIPCKSFDDASAVRDSDCSRLDVQVEKAEAILNGNELEMKNESIGSCDNLRDTERLIYKVKIETWKPSTNFVTFEPGIVFLDSLKFLSSELGDIVVKETEKLLQMQILSSFDCCALKKIMDTKVGQVLKTAQDSDKIITIKSVDSSAMGFGHAKPSSLFMKQITKKLVKKNRPGRKGRLTLREMYSAEPVINEVKRSRLKDEGREMYCDKCDIRFKSSKSLLKHRMAHHIDRKCSYCDTVFAVLRELKIHEKEHEKMNELRCKICDTEFSGKQSMEKHNLLKHNIGEFVKCEICEKEFYSKYSLYFHKKNVHSDEQHLCQHCGFIFRSSGLLTTHIQCKHIVHSNIVCSICNKSFKNRRKLTIHMRCHRKKSGVFTCEKCYKTFYSEQGIKKHMQWHKTVPLTCCKICGITFRHSNRLSSHIKKMHWTSVNKPASELFPCLICGVMFIEGDSLEQHLLFHFKENEIGDVSGSNEGDVKCLECEKYLRDKKQLALHKFYIHRGLPFKCCVNGCSESFWSKAALDAHSVSTHGRFAYECKKCEETFNSIKQKNIHLREVHLVQMLRGRSSGRRQYICDTCNKSFCSSFSLKRHLFVKHQRVQESYVCDMCGECFSLKRELKKHVLRHEESKKSQDDIERTNEEQEENVIIEDTVIFDECEVIVGDFIEFSDFANGGCNVLVEQDGVHKQN